MKYLVDAIITNRTSGKSTAKAWTVNAVDLDHAYNLAGNSIGGNESIIIKNICTVSDFSHPF